MPETGVQSDNRFVIHRLADGGDSNAFATDVRTGLNRAAKSLPPKYFYDELGSRLFEAICCLPEYYLTRAESEILRSTANRNQERDNVSPVLQNIGAGVNRILDR